MKLKILPLELEMEYSEYRYRSREQWIEELSEWSTPISPVIGRDGYYYDRSNKRCWFEVEGYAFKANPDQFLLELEMQNHKPLSDKEAEAARYLIRAGIAVGKEFKELYYKDCRWKELRDTYRSARARTIRIIYGVVGTCRRI